MSYNTRKNANNYNASPIPSSIGQRRAPQQQNNFVSGGQLTPTVQPVVQMPVNQQNRNAPATRAQQQPKQMQQTPIKANLPQTPVKVNQPIKQQAQTPQTPQEAKIVFKTEVATPAPAVLATPVVPALSTDLDETKLLEGMDTNEEDDGSSPKKPFWMKNSKGKISKAEKVRRRNQRLKKIISPKNALMVLNELVGSASYELVEASTIPGMKATAFNAFVTVEGIKHQGFGKSKIGAKTAAAEAALKHIIMQKIASGALSTTPKTPADNESTDVGMDCDGDVKMAEEDELNKSEAEDTFSWSHLASFALHKLFNSWDETGNISRTPSLTNLSVDMPLAKPLSGLAAVSATVAKSEMKPSKKLPANADQMNPVMLLNQMHPEAIYDEICKTGAPPRINFTLKCTVGTQVFVGHGNTKKTARKNAAHHACRDLLGIQYPAEVFEDNRLIEAPIAPDISDVAAVAVQSRHGNNRSNFFGNNNNANGNMYSNFWEEY